MTKNKFQVDIENKNLERCLLALEKAGAKDITPRISLTKKGIVEYPLSYTAHFTAHKLDWKEYNARMHN